MRQIIALYLAALMLAAQPLQAAVCVGFGQEEEAPSGYSDDFEGTNDTALATHDANWADLTSTYPVGGMKINGGLALCSNSYGINGARYTASTADISQITHKAQSVGNGAQKRLHVRTSSSSLGYAMYLNTPSGVNFTKVQLTKNGGYLDDCNVSIPYGSDHVFKITATGTSTVTVTAFVDTTQVCQTTDSSSPIGTGNPGFSVSGDGTASDNTFDDWSDN